MSVITWVHAQDCFPPHGLDMTAPRNYKKVEMLIEAFTRDGGFDKSKSALLGYPLDGKIQLLSGTHRHRAAEATGILLPVMLWLRSDIERVWGDLESWVHVMRDIPVSLLETWTREDVEKMRLPKGLGEAPRQTADEEE